MHITIPSAFHSCSRNIDTHKGVANIQINISNDIPNAALAIHEFIPQGLKPINISENGQWFPENRHIKWGTFLNEKSIIITYRIAGPPGSYNIDGQVSVNGQIEIIAGEEEINLSLCPLEIQIYSLPSMSDYEIALVSVCDDIPLDVTENANFSVSDPSLVSIQDNFLTALENTRLTLTALYQDQIVEKIVYLKSTYDMMEMEQNNSKIQATAMAEKHFMEGELLKNDNDYFKIELSCNTLLELAYLSRSDIADIKN